MICENLRSLGTLQIQCKSCCCNLKSCWQSQILTSHIPLVAFLRYMRCENLRFPATFQIAAETLTLDLKSSWRSQILTSHIPLAGGGSGKSCWQYQMLTSHISLVGVYEMWDFDIASSFSDCSRDASTGCEAV